MYPIAGGSKGITYRHYTQKPTVAFGTGLSYTSFVYSNLRINASTIGACDTVGVLVDVANTGAVDSDEVRFSHVHSTSTRLLCRSESRALYRAGHPAVRPHPQRYSPLARYPPRRLRAGAHPGRCQHNRLAAAGANIPFGGHGEPRRLGSQVLGADDQGGGGCFHAVCRWWAARSGWWTRWAGDGGPCRLNRELHTKLVGELHGWCSELRTTSTLSDGCSL